MTLDELRQMFGFDALEIKGLTDVPILSLNKMPMSEAPEPIAPNEPEPKPVEEEEEPVPA